MTEPGPSAANVLFEAQDIEAIVARLAADISADHPDGVLLVSVLKSGVLALADIARRLTVPCEIDFLALSPYAADSGRVRILKDLDHDIAGQDVVVLSGLVDTGLKLGFLRGELGRRNPGNLRSCTMFDKSARRILPVPIEYVGAEVPDAFLIGYGLDYAGRYRNTSCVAAVDLDALRADPDCCRGLLYR